MSVMGATNDASKEIEEVYREEVEPRKDGNSTIIPIPAVIAKMPVLRGKQFFWVVSREGLIITAKLEIVKV